VSQLLHPGTSAGPLKTSVLSLNSETSACRPAKWIDHSLLYTKDLIESKTQGVFISCDQRQLLRS